MRLCASLFRGVAAPLGCVICLQLGDVAVFSLCAQYFLIVPFLSKFFFNKDDANRAIKVVHDKFFGNED